MRRECVPQLIASVCSWNASSPLNANSWVPYFVDAPFIMWAQTCTRRTRCCLIKVQNQVGLTPPFPVSGAHLTCAQLTSPRPSSGDPYIIDHCQDEMPWMRDIPCAPTPQILGSLLILAVPLFLSHFSSLASVVRPSWSGIGDALESSPKTVAD